MTDQSTREQWTPSAPTMHRADPDWADPKRTGENGAVDDGVVRESAVEPDVDEQPADGNTVDEPGTEGAFTGYAADEDTSAETLHRSQPAGPDRTDPEQSVGGISALDGEPAAEPETGILDRAVVNSPAADDTAGAAIAAPQPQAAENHDGIDAVTDTRQPAADQERAEITGDEAPVAEPAAEVAAFGVAGSGELLPAERPQEPVPALLDGQTTDGFRDRWQRLQLQFIDDPRSVASQAGALVDEVVTALHDAVDRRRAALEDWQPSNGTDAHAEDTERLRVAVHHYRDFLDHLLGR